jgi:ABC-type iron transport system FetAB ATPase subunit
MDSRAWLSLPRASGIAYAAQESWVLNDTIRNNIVFTSEWDEERYKKGGPDILENDVQLMLTGTFYKYCISADWRKTLACSKLGMRRKLARRVSLSGSSRIARPPSCVNNMLTVYYSGGQKARVTLARAIYSLAQTILLDDVSDMLWVRLNTSG